MNSISYTTSPLEFELAEQPIDYFKIPIDVLQANGFAVTMNEIPLRSDEFLDVNSHMGNINHANVETVVFNIQVGKGKTRACYDLIEKYAKEGYIVLVLSPFKKLVEKDHANLTKRGLEAFNYEHLGQTMEAAKQPGYHFNFQPHVDHNIHVMTINCLLQNPGEAAYDQLKIKQEFLQGVLNSCYDEDRIEKKVVMFFDEIHESIHNFKDEFIPNLIKWKGVVHKAYISSATFTPAAIPAIQRIGAITGGNITVYETPRLKIDQPVSLHLHLFEQGYSGQNLMPVDYLLRKIIEDNKSKQINMLTGHKSMANGLVDADKNPDNTDLINAVGQLKPNLITGENDNEFKQDRNNLGTAFKTGVDIEQSDSVFVCILPCISGNDPKYGIFSDGLPSIIQSMARIRRIGHVHVLMLKPSTIINRESNLSYLPQEITDNTDTEGYIPQNSFYTELEATYNRLKKRVEEQIAALNDIQTQGNLQLGSSYPTFSNYLVEDSQKKLLANHYSYGKELNAYILWGAINGQFCNATLAEITYTSIRRRRLELTKDTAKSAFKDLLTDDAVSQAAKLDLPAAIELLLKSLDTVSSNEDGKPGASEKVQFVVNNRQINAGAIKSSPQYVQSLIETYAAMATKGKVTRLTKEDYILACAGLAGSVDVEDVENDRILEFHKLDQLRKDFLDFMAKQAVQNGKSETLIHRDAYTQLQDSFIAECEPVIVALNGADKLLSDKVFPFIPSMGNIADTTGKKAAIYKEFEKCFTNVTGKKKTYNNLKDEYYLIDGSIERTLSPNILDVRLL